MRPVVEKRFEYKGYPCVVLMQPLCFRTGYVGLPKGNQYFHKNYNAIPVYCHGGLTYASDDLYGQTDEDTWWIGFDTGHYGDGHDFEEGKRLYAGNEEALKSIEMCERTMFYHDGPARTLRYCEHECKRIVDQLIKNEGGK